MLNFTLSSKIEITVFHYLFYLFSSFFSANILFEMWNKYQPLLPQKFFEEKLMDMGDFLLGIKVNITTEY